MRLQESDEGDDFGTGDTKHRHSTVTLSLGCAVLLVTSSSIVFLSLRECHTIQLS